MPTSKPDPFTFLVFAVVASFLVSYETASFIPGFVMWLVTAMIWNTRAGRDE